MCNCFVIILMMTMLSVLRFVVRCVALRCDFCFSVLLFVKSLLLYDWRKIRLIVINNRTSTNTTKLSHSSSEDVDQVPSANTTTTTAVVVEKVATGVA